MIRTRPLLLTAVSALLFVGTGGAIADSSNGGYPEGPESPETCSFENGTTTCAATTTATEETSVPSDPYSGCTIATRTTTTTTTYTAHRGTYNSNGKAVPAPADAVTQQSETLPESCPAGSGRAELKVGGMDCTALSAPDGAVVGTVYYQRSGSDSIVTYVANATPSAGFATAVKCVDWILWSQADAAGNIIFTQTLGGRAGQTQQFDLQVFGDGGYYSYTDTVQL